VIQVITRIMGKNQSRSRIIACCVPKSFLLVKLLGTDKFWDNEWLITKWMRSYFRRRIWIMSGHNRNTHYIILTVIYAQVIFRRKKRNYRGPRKKWGWGTEALRTDSGGEAFREGAARPTKCMVVLRYKSPRWLLVANDSCFCEGWLLCMKDHDPC